MMTRDQCPVPAELSRPDRESPKVERYDGEQSQDHICEAMAHIQLGP